MPSGFVDVNLNDIPPVHILPPGPALVRITKVENEVAKTSGANMISLQLQAMEDPSAEMIFERLVLPNSNHDEKATRFMMLRLRSACEAFDVDFSEEGFDSSEFQGKEAEVLIDIDQYNNEDRNTVKSWIVS